MFFSYFDNAKAINSLMEGQSLILDSKGVKPTLYVGYVNRTLTPEQEANAFTVTSQLFVREGLSLSSFEEYASCLNRSASSLTSRPTYQSFDGFANNLNHPFWGAAETPFGRLGPKNYADGVGVIRRTELFSQALPQARKIVDDVLIKAKKAERIKNPLNSMWLQFLVGLANDLGHTAAVASQTPGEKINCCTAGNQAMLPRFVSNPACKPIAISKTDRCYKKSGIKCQSFVRAQQVSTPSGVDFGEYLESPAANRFTTFFSQVKSRTKQAPLLICLSSTEPMPTKTAK
jgi:hypothetical protein